MVIDKDGIKAIWRESEDDLKKHKDEDGICITTRFNDFNPEKQISNDSIDLRINNQGFTISDDYEFINTLSEEDFSKYFTKVILPLEQGYDMKPGELLFIDTLERIHLNGNLIGRITGRSVFSRFGLSVHCTQDKFSSGINSIVALQIVNNSKTTLKIFPYQKLAQLIIHKTSHNSNPYSGSFKDEDSLKFPIVKEGDRLQYDDRIKATIKRLIPQKKALLKRSKRSARLNSLAQSVLGMLVSAGICIFGFFDITTVSIISIVLLAVIYLIGSYYFYNISEE